ncbi:MAG: pyruvate, phosphate dikinase [Candidatus Micrarchaeota archaeon]|nr:pyruvate, phosphate dikinase [Candidatus Micrarchaeota archaeon]
MAKTKAVYQFKEGSSQMRQILGGKGCELSEMTRIGLPVPPGIVVTTEQCLIYQKTKKISKDLRAEIFKALAYVERQVGKKFGDEKNPLLVSVRSGAPVSMPGMMDTILNLGLNDKTVVGFAKNTNERTAYDAYRRLIQMFGEVVLEIKKEKFDKIFDSVKEEHGRKQDIELTVDELKEIISKFRHLVHEETGKGFPDDPHEQLMLAVEAVFNSWNNPRAITYRNIYKIPHDMGTAVVIQAMVFGNTGQNSGTGVAFTRNPSTGEKKLYGEYLINAQGEDVVAGIRTPQPIEKMKREMPKAYKELERIAKLLEKHYREMQDMEFTIENGKLWMLQTRAGKRTAAAAVKIAVDMVKEGLINKEEAIMRVSPSQIDQLLHRQIDPSVKVSPIAKGLPASPGAATGKIVFTADEAAELGKKEKVMLVAVETTPDDIHGMIASQGILTSRGGMTCHAAVVARGLGLPSVVGCEAAKVDLDKKTLTINGKVFKEGDIITIDGSTGNVIEGEVRLIEPTISGEFDTFLSWCDSAARMKVRANADTPSAAKGARKFGAKGIGLCRTERMFNDPERLPIVQKMILSETAEERKKWLAKLKEFQVKDFYEIFLAMDGLPVTVRLLDPPLHEFLPKLEELLAEIAELSSKKVDERVIEEKQILLKKVRELQEFNPMLGHRGSRLGITYPEIYEMQVSAIFEAAAKLKKDGKNPIVEVMVPLIGNVNELKILKPIIKKTADEILAREKVKLNYTIGTMIEIPRAALTADEIAQEAEFFSFGTNDLTQTTLGFSRDDAESKFLQLYLSKEIYKDNPFEVVDYGVGKLVDMAVKLGRSTRKNLKTGVCGETGGEPNSIHFYHGVGLDYVSCSQYRVPIARLSCAQATIKEKQKGKIKVSKTD